MLSVLQNCDIIDLSHSLSEDNPTWVGESGFHSQIDHDFSEVGCRVMSYRLIAGVGTHMDAPLHFEPHGKDIASIAPKDLVAPLCIIRLNLADQPEYLISKSDILSFENKFGLIPENSFVAADTSWAIYWKDNKRYRNVDSEGNMHFPGFSIEAAELLLERKIVGIGLDTLSPDGKNTEFYVHHLLLPNGKYMIENLANLEKVPERGAWIVALPPKITGGSESPCRCIALVPLSEK